jgi:hypothetical protein
MSSYLNKFKIAQSMKSNKLKTNQVIANSMNELSKTMTERNNRELRYAYARHMMENQPFRNHKNGEKVKNVVSVGGAKKTHKKTKKSRK